MIKEFSRCKIPLRYGVGTDNVDVDAATAAGIIVGLQCVKVELSPDEKTVSIQAHNLDEVATVKLENKANGLSGQVLVPLVMLGKISKGCSVNQSIRLVASKQETKIRYPVAGSFVDRALTDIPIEEWPDVTPAAPPSVPGVDHTTVESKQTMSTSTTMTAPERGNIRSHTNGTTGQEENGQSRSSFKAALEHIDQIKTNLRDVLSDLNDAVTMLKTADKEQKATSKEIESVGAKLREIQSVEI